MSGKNHRMVVMKVIVAVAVVVCAAACAAQVLDLPKLTDEERKLILSNMDIAVDCLIKPTKQCPNYTENVRRVLPDLLRNNFKCNCETQRDVDLFRAELGKRKNSRAMRRLTMWVNTELLV
ncbi:uncharacterized protein LOC135111732 isoform X1 [Scylla paramamosain]